MTLSLENRTQEVQEELNDALAFHRSWKEKPTSIDAQLYVMTILEDLLKEGIVPGTPDTMVYDPLQKKSESGFYLILEDLYKQCYTYKGHLRRIAKDSTEKLEKINAATGEEKERLTRDFVVWREQTYVKVAHQDKVHHVLPGCYILSLVRKGEHYPSAEDIPKWIATIQELQEKIPAYVASKVSDLPPPEVPK